MLLVGCSSSNQATFSSPEKAADKLIVAMRNNDTKTLGSLFGPDSDELIYSGDSVADRQRFQKFVAAYDQRHRLEMDKDAAVTLIVGSKDWPCPIPIVQGEDDKWYFDTDAGREEILNRRIGENELNVIEVCRAIVDAQKEYALMDPDKDGVPEYARQFGSNPGKKNGLFWPAASGEVQSPLGQFVADAVAEGYGETKSEAGKLRPYHGYCYRMLTAQGPGAQGGAADYIVNGRMIGGFAVVAFPAEYASSGVMSFIVNQKGTVYQMDLGDNTRDLAMKMQAFDPAGGWQPVQSSTSNPQGHN
jgi:hypothetical protein